MMLSINEVSGSYHSCRPLTIVIDKQKESFVLCPYGCQVQVIGQSSGEMIGSFRGHQSTVTSVNDSPDTHMKTSLSGIDTSQSRFPAIFSSSIDGTVFLWTATIDLSMKVSFHVLFEWKTKQTIHSLWIPVKNKQISKSSDFETLSSNIENVTCDLEISVQTFYIIGKGDSNRKVLKRIDMSPNRGKSMKAFFDLPILPSNCSYSMGDIRARGEQYLVIATKLLVRLILTGTPIDQPPVFIAFASHGREIVTTLTTNIERGLLVTGHRNGEMRIWHGLLTFISGAKLQPKNQGNAPTYTSIHWHANPVTSLSLSPDCLSLCSGGSEAVLVLWKISSGQGSTHNAADRTFLPRLGATIASISNISTAVSGGLRVAVTTTDNCLRSININSICEDWSLKSLSLPSRSDRYSFRQTDLAWKCRLTVESRSGLLLMNGSPAELQAYDALRNYSADSYQILSYVRVTATDSKHKVQVPAVTHFKTTTYPLFGHILVTVDVQRTSSEADDGTDIEFLTTIKFWQWVALLNTYALRAEMENPHLNCPALSGSCPAGQVRVTDLCLSPCCYEEEDGAVHPIGRVQGRYLLCASAAEDGSIKIWKGFSQKEASRRSDAASMNWLALYSFRYRESPVAGLGFSADGSLLVAAYGSLVTLWCPNSVQLKGSFLNPTTSAIEFSAFIEPNQDAMEGGGGDSLLVLGSKRSMSVVNLLDLQHLWTITVPGSFTAWAVASREAECLAGSAGSKGWIAVGYCHKNTETDKNGLNPERSNSVALSSATSKLGPVGIEVEKVKDDKAPVEWTNEVWVFDPYSSTPIFKTPKIATLGRVSCLAYLSTSSGPEAQAEMMGKGATSIAQIPRLAVVAEEPSSLFLLRTAIAETEVAAEGDTVPQSSVVTARSRKQVSLPSLPLPPSNPAAAAADDQDEQIRKKVRLADVDSRARPSELFLDGTNEHRTTAAVYERYLQLAVVPRLAHFPGDKKG